MQEENQTSITARDVNRQLLAFIQRLYWLLGAFCLYWFTRLEVADYRMLQEQSLDFPILGPCFASEALVFTLTFAWVPLLLLHACTHAYQGYFVARQHWGGFPGVLGDSPIPPGLAWLRMALFVAVVALPTGAYVWSSHRAITRLNLHWSHNLQASFHGAESLSVWGPPKGEPAQWGIFTPGWSWQHKDGEWRERVHPKNAAQDNREKASHMVPVTTSAYPGIQPAFYLLMDAILLFSLGKLILHGCMTTGVRRTRGTAP